MKVARYKTEAGDGLRVVFQLTEEEYEHIGRPVRGCAKMRDDGTFTVLAGKSGVFSKRKDEEWRFLVNAPLFPGTKTFGVEEVEVELGSLGRILALAPTQEKAVAPRRKKRGSSEQIRDRKEAVEKMPDADLVRELRRRVRANPMWVVEPLEGGRDFRIVVSGSIN